MDDVLIEFSKTYFWFSSRYVLLHELTQSHNVVSFTVNTQAYQKSADHRHSWQV